MPIYRKSGLKSMALLIGETDRVQRLAWLRVSWSRVKGTTIAVEKADLVLSLDESAGRLGGSEAGFDGELYRVKNVGISAPVHIRVQEDEIARWRLGAGQRLKASWTSPDAGEILWKLECELTDGS